VTLTSTEVTAWSGGVNNHLVVSENDSDFDDMEWDSDSSEDEVDKLEGAELVDSLQREIEHEICLLQELEPTPYERLMTVVTEKEWKRAEQKRGLGYNGCGERNVSVDGCLPRWVISSRCSIQSQSIQLKEVHISLTSSRVTVRLIRLQLSYLIINIGTIT